jgi:hypothetical protein
MPAFERLSSGFGTFGFVGVIWIDSYSPRTQALLGLAVVRRIVSTSIEMLQSGRIRTTQKTLGKHEKVRILSSPLKNPGFSRVFRISGQFLWPTVAPMQLGAWRLRRCISRRAAQIESFFESRESRKHWSFACAGSATIHADRGCRIRTICVISLIKQGTDPALKGTKARRM